jgi:predicted RNA-binding Zn ribbon-like protein
LTLEDAQAAGFPLGGEPLAVDLADTIVTITDPAIDLLAEPGRLKAFWTLHAADLPDGWATPSMAATVELRTAVRALLDAAVTPRNEPPAWAVRVVNQASALAPASPALAAASGHGYVATERWASSRGADLALAAVARSVIAALTEVPTDRLRRCANPQCSMLFVAEDARRKWCTANICGNRTRVARHYHRHHGER